MVLYHISRLYWTIHELHLGEGVKQSKISKKITFNFLVMKLLMRTTTKVGLGKCTDDGTCYQRLIRCRLLAVPRMYNHMLSQHKSNHWGVFVATVGASCRGWYYISHYEHNRKNTRLFLCLLPRRLVFTVFDIRLEEIAVRLYARVDLVFVVPCP